MDITDVIANKDIWAGEEIFVSYGDRYFTDHSREKYSVWDYNFNLSCQNGLISWVFKNPSSSFLDVFSIIPSSFNLFVIIW